VAKDCQYQWRGSVVLTSKEGAVFEKLLSQYNCANASQFCKKIVHGEIPLADTQPESQTELQMKVAQCERMLIEIKKLLP
jgi:hypothetical protein